VPPERGEENNGQQGMRRKHRAALVLFDLDGTLIDSAPDLAAAANQMLEARGRASVAYEALRPMAGSGARGMLQVAFAVRPGDGGYEALRDEFHERYERCMLERTRVFEAMLPVLAQLDANAVRWGIVTNKAMRFAEPMARALGLLPAAAVLIAGDTTPHRKPHPAPLLEAARRLACNPLECAYVGDDARDMAAGRAAGMATVAAAWGYLGPGASVQDWAADAILHEPAEILNWLRLP
jgi:phosphoglycolate phosphatase